MATWNQAFEETPADTDPGSVIPDKFHELKGAIQERIALEHQMVKTETGNHGRHKLGSARAFVDDATVTDRAPIPPATASDNDVGRIHFKPTKRQLLVMGPPSIGQPNEWRELDYVHKDETTDETIAGRKTLTLTPVISEAQLEGSAPNRTYISPFAVGSTRVPTIDTMEKRVSDLIAAAKIEAVKAAHPTGSTYIQLPGTSNPTTLWPVGTYGMVWDDVSLSYAGLFMRIDRGGAKAFVEGSIGDSTQGAVIAEHTHSETRRTGIRDVDTNGDDLVSDKNYETVQTGGVAGLNAAIGTSATENRPANVTVRIWKRTS